ncbi:MULTISPECIES: tyrosine-type recombinase/integrase [Blautia]|uniref:tyrosine-type recombinase/integrase n=1 Tax=Blautia TaxID=572511 RepID=UPI00136A1A21|nr:tyrosine-type recombinase/integrase [Blautia sp. BIOML-A1]MZT67040.1 tyrosine-type recombinase/integrase [Blautia sp. BIOML-A1]
MNKYCEEALQRQIVLHKMVINNSPKLKGERTNYIFCTIYGTPLCSQIYADAIARIVKEINYSRDPLETMEKFSGHCFRHTFVTRCFEADIPPKTVQTYLGHATLQMTMDLYTSVMDKKKIDDIQLLEDTIGLDEIDKPDPNSKIIKLA